MYNNTKQCTTIQKQCTTIQKCTSHNFIFTVYHTNGVSFVLLNAVTLRTCNRNSKSCHSPSILHFLAERETHHLHLELLGLAIVALLQRDVTIVALIHRALRLQTNNQIPRRA